MIKVLQVITDSNIGGAGKLLLCYLQNRDRDQFSQVVALPTDSALIPELQKLGVAYLPLHHLTDRSFSIGGVRETRRLIRFLRPDVVHTHAAFCARLGARWLGCGVVATRHSVFDQPNYKKHFPYRQLWGILNNRTADRIIAVSPAAKENITEIGADPALVTVVFNGVDPIGRLSGEQRAQARAKWNIPADAFVCAIIARLTEVKGHNTVLDAAKLLPDVVFLIAGTGDAEQALRRRVAQEQISNIIFCGFVKEVWEIENCMDLQLNASFGTEATSLSLLEGMSLGIPAVVSDFGGNPYVILQGENGLVVPKKDPEALAVAIRRLKEDRALYGRLSQGAQQIYQQRFTSDAMARGIEAVYRAVAQKGGR